MRRYSEAVKADVRRRMSPPQRQSVAQISAVSGDSENWSGGDTKIGPPRRASQA